jgi:hypothetical protein
MLRLPARALAAQSPRRFPASAPARRDDLAGTTVIALASQ